MKKTTKGIYIYICKFLDIFFFNSQLCENPAIKIIRKKRKISHSYRHKKNYFMFYKKNASLLLIVVIKVYVGVLLQKFLVPKVSIQRNVGKFASLLGMLKASKVDSWE